MATKNGRQQVSAPLVDYLLGHPNTILTKSRIAKAISRTENQVAAAMYSLGKIAPDIGDHVFVVQNNNSWRYDPVTEGNDSGEGNDDKTYFQLVDEFKDGALLLKCEDGLFYRAERFG